jgi:hypothetical protein
VLSPDFLDLVDGLTILVGLVGRQDPALVFNAFTHEGGSGSEINKSKMEF